MEFPGRVVTFHVGHTKRGFFSLWNVDRPGGGGIHQTAFQSVPEHLSIRDAVRRNKIQIRLRKPGFWWPYVGKKHQEERYMTTRFEGPKGVE